MTEKDEIQKVLDHQAEVAKARKEFCEMWSTLSKEPYKSSEGFQKICWRWFRYGKGLD